MKKIVVLTGGTSDARRKFDKDEIVFWKVITAARDDVSGEKFEEFWQHCIRKYNTIQC